MYSDDLFSRRDNPQAQWDALEERINRLLETVVQLRGANAELMRENVQMKKQLKDIEERPNGSPEELQTLRKQYEESLQDLRQVKQNLERIESLADDLGLEG